MRDRGFFVEDLLESLFGDEAVDPTRRARRFLAPFVFEHHQAIRAAFPTGEGAAHARLKDALLERPAKALAAALRGARFRRPPEPGSIDLAPWEELRAPAARAFCAWLASAEGARFHGWLAGVPVTRTKAVQVSRARLGDEIPLHHDLPEDGLVSLYDFSEPFGPDDGGVHYLASPHAERAHALLASFNTLTVFRAGDVRRGMTRITGEATQWTITASFVGSA